MPKAVFSLRYNTLMPQPLPLPALPHRLLERCSLQTRLAACFTHALTLIIAPAGFGKSTLVLQGLKNMAHPVLWLSLTRWHNQPKIFWGAVIQALQTLNPELGKTTQSYLQLPELPPSATYLAPLLDDLQHLSDPLLWVLDDFQVLENPDIYQALEPFLLSAGPHLRLLICSRQSPHGLPISRLRGRQQLGEITAADLCFSADEIQALLEQNGLRLEPEAFAQVWAYTEGWPWCVQLVMGYLASSAPERWHEALQQSQSHRLNYMIDEIFSDLPADLQQFLLTLSILSTLNAPLCDALTGRSDSATLLHYLAEQQVFIVPMDPLSSGYHFHPVMAELLQQRLHQTARGQVAALHHQAMAWFQEHGEYDQAIAHGLQARAFESVTELIRARAYPMMAQGQIVQLGEWLEQIPETDRVAEDLQLFTIWALILTHRLEQAEGYLVQLPEDLNPQHENLWATLARKRGQFQQVIVHSCRALEASLENYSPFIQNFIQGTAWFNLGIAYLGKQDYPRSMQAFERSLPFQHAIHNLLTALAARVCQARIYLYQGQLEQAAFLYQQALYDAEKWQLGKHSIVGTVRLDQALMAYYQGDNEACLDLLALGLAHTTGAYNADSIYGFKLALELYCRLQAWERASSCLTAAEAFAREQEHLPFLANLDAFRRWLWFGQKQWHVLESHYHLERPLVTEIDALVQVRYEILRYHVAPTLPQLRACAHQRPALALEIMLLEALLSQATRQDSQHKLIQALDFSLNYPLVGVWREYEALLPAIQPLAKQLSFPHQAFLHQVWPQRADHPTETLSSREIELLQLINQGLSNQELAAHLVVSLNTIKTHLKNIFRKLEVNSRTQAVAKARLLQLIGEREL